MVTSLFPQNLCVVLLVLKANWCKGDYWTDCHSNKPDSCEVGHYPTSSNRYSPWAWNEYFCLAFWQEHYLCVSCPAGKSSPEGKECKACVPGRYSDLQNLDLCKPCIAGYYQDDHYNTGCKQCGLGQYQNDEAMHHCKICPPGHFQAAVSQSSCNSCAMGQYQNDVGQTSCKFCSKGVYQDQTAGSGCKDCEPGKYQESIGQRRCKKCGRGRFSDSVAANSIEYCHYCTESGGKFSPEGSTSCTDCEAGLFMAPNVPEDERNACRFCPAGYFQKERGKPDCQKCPSGYHKAFSFHSAQDHVACKACPGGYYAEETGLGACKKCGLGRFSSSWALTSNCELCPSGKLTYDSTGQTECKNCPVGTFLPEMLRGRRDCLPCNNNAEGATTCNGCEPGKWGHGDFGCNRCEDGKFSTGGMSSGCKDCPMGYYSKARNQIRDECLACVGGFYSETERANSSRVCIACRKGRFGSKPQGQGDSEDCIDCPAGRYANATGLSNRAQCLECPLGRRSSIEGLSSECEECKSGRFSSVIGKHTQECNRCPPGKMQNMTGQALCIECPKGYYQDLFEERECLYCPRGWHQRSSGMVRCEPCSPGYYQPKPGESFCTECTPGRINSFTALADKCIKCEKGKFMENFRSTATECDKCPGGYFQSKEGQTSCLPCGVGRFRAENSYASECQECPGGFFQSSFGSTDCDECQAGRYQSIPGQLSCIKCIPGQFSSAKKQRECEACPEGWFQVKSGSRNCSVPTQGTIALPGGTGVSFIAQGWHGTNCSDTMCRSSEPCPPGTRFVEGDFSCVTCEPGKWSSLSSLICRDCEKGKFAPMAGMSECQICNEDDLEYADEEGLTKCKVCEWDERSTRFNCEKIGFDPSLPLVIGRPFIHRIARNESNLWDDSSKRAVVLWEGLRDKQGYIRNPLKPTELQLQLSTDPEFLVNTTLYTGIATDALKFFPPTPIPISNEPLCDRIIYARLRSAYNVLKTRKYGMWSQASESWRSTGSNDCARPSQYLDCSISHKPLEWSCKECPKGAVCETPETTSVRWNQVHSASGYWRDNRVSSMTRTTKNLPLDLVPRNFMFVKCVNDKSSASMCPEGEIDNNGRVRETCGLGYLNICDKATNSSCRLCRTCDQGYVMISFGSHFICKSCSSAGSEDRNDSLILIVAISSIVLFVYGLLVFLKIKSSTMNQNFRTKAAHSTIKRILLTHMQVVMLSIGLNVPWPSMILSMLRIFAAISSINQHVDELGCYLDMGEAVGKQSRFLYWSTTVASLFPIAFTALLWIYWVLFVPLPCCGCLACGRKTHLTLSDPVPNFCRKCCGGKSSNHGREYFKKRIEDTMSKFNEKKSSVENPISTIKIEPPQILASDQNYLENTADDSLSSSALANEFAKRREVLLKKILEDQRLKTRDIWVYSTVLFLCELQYSLLSTFNLPKFEFLDML